MAVESTPCLYIFWSLSDARIRTMPTLAETTYKQRIRIGLFISVYVNGQHTVVGDALLRV